MRKRVLFILALFAAMFFLSGCNSEISLIVSATSDGKGLLYRLVVTLDAAEEKTLDDSAKSGAAVKHNKVLEEYRTKDGEPWIIAEYLKTYIDRAGDYRFSLQKMTQEKKSNGEVKSTSYIFEGVVLYDEMTDEGGDIVTKTPEAERTVKKGFFFVKTRVETDCPLTYARGDYENAKTGGAGSASIFDIFHNGHIWSELISEGNEAKIEDAVARGGVYDGEDNGKAVYKFVAIPPFFEIFPATANSVSFNPDMLTLNYYMRSDARLKTSGTTAEDSAGRQYYLWPMKFTEDGSKLVYERTQANPVGWNIVAIAAGVLVVAALLIISKLYKKNTPEPDLKERFPYDPSQNIDPFDGNDFDPFA